MALSQDKDLRESPRRSIATGSGLDEPEDNFLSLSPTKTPASAPSRSNKTQPKARAACLQAACPPE